MANHSQQTEDAKTQFGTVIEQQLERVERLKNEGDWTDYSAIEPIGIGMLGGDGIGPAIIAATTISGTMVMGLAPIFLLSFLPGAGPASCHMAFWPGRLFGVLITVESAAGLAIFPACIDMGGGKYADDLGVNVYGLLVCTGGYLVGALLFGRRAVTSPIPSS